MMRQYRELKRRYPDYLLLFRLGDFYELFFEDAHAGVPPAPDHADLAPEGRGRDPDGGHPAPRRRRLHRAPHPGRPEGGRVRADGGAGQGQEARPARGRPRHHARARSPTPSTSTAPPTTSCSPLHAHRRRGRRRAGRRLHRRVLGGRGAGRGRGAARGRAAAPARRDPRRPERGAAGGWPGWAPPGVAGDARATAAPSGRGAAREVLAAHFRARRLDGFGVGDARRGAPGGRAPRWPTCATPRASRSATSPASSACVPGDAMLLDPTAVATLELFETAQERTAPRLALRHARQDRHAHGRAAAPPVAAAPAARPGGHPAPPGCRRRPSWRLPRPATALRRRLRGVGDLERLTSRAALGVAHARDLVALRGFLGRLPGLREELGGLRPPLLADARGGDHRRCPTFRSCLRRRSRTSRRSTLREGGLIREGWNAELRRAQARRAARRGRGSPRSSSASGSARASASSRVRFNRVFGYAIEVSNAHAAKVPADYIRRQTLVGAERYVTAELKEYESRVLGAEERIARLELELFGEVRAQVAAQAAALLRTARAVGTLDALASLADGGPRARIRAAGGRRRPRARDRRRPPSGARGGRRRRSRPTTCGSIPPTARS